MATKTRTPAGEHVGTAWLAQLAALDARGISAETARAFLALRFGPEHHARFEALSEKARHGALTPAEERELDESIRLGNILAILQSKARQALKHAGLPA